jgi:acyl-CoA reductase-like NAD-dependent aldehyde dehydrogenase
MDIKLFINNEFKNSSENKSYESYDPSSGELLAKVQLPSLKDVEDAVTAAHQAFYSSEWRTFKNKERSELLLKVSELLMAKKADFIDLEVKDSGSSLRKAKADLHNSASFFKVMSKVAADFKFEVMDEKATRAGFSKNTRIYEPVGVCAQIIPWNFPLVMAAWKVGPILATGCTSVLKSAMETPITASLLASVLKEAGMPKGVINIITGDATIGQALVNHPKVNKVAFTGSTRAGKEILKNAASTVKRTTMELGGKSANIVLNDADLDIAVDGALYAFLYHSGQACDSGTRLLIQEEIYPEFTKRLIARMKDIKVLPTSNPAASYGPVVSKKQFETIMSYIEKTKAEGARLLYGGQRVKGGEFEKGFFIEPTAFEINPNNTIFKEEIFGPVVGLTKFKTIEEAVKLANDSSYGLAGAVWSKDETKAQTVARQLEAGTVWINEYHLLNPGMPFGGYKESGLGREMGLEGIHAYLEVKHLWESDCNTRATKPWFDAIF